MSMDDLLRAFEIIETHSAEADFDGPKDEGLVKAAELALGLDFPPTYRLFLSRYGTGAIFGQEIYGLIGPDFINSGIPDAIWLTLKKRKDGLRRDVVVIYELGDGTYAGLDCSVRGLDRENPVIAWIPGFDDRQEQWAADFGEFLLEMLQPGRR